MTSHKGTGLRVRPMYGRGRHGDYGTATIREALGVAWSLRGLVVPAKRQVSP